MKKKMIIFTLLVLTMCFGTLTGCGNGSHINSATHPGGDKDSDKDSAMGGILHLNGDSEFAITYDKDGKVTAVTARNEKGKDVLAKYTGYVGKEVRQVVSGLVGAMGAAGHFTAEATGETKKLAMEIQKDSKLPHDSFLDDLVNDVRSGLKTGKWDIPFTISGASHYGLSDDKYNNSATNQNGTDKTNNTENGNNQNNNGNAGTGDRNNQNRDDDYDDGIFDDDRYDDDMFDDDRNNNNRDNNRTESSTTR